MNLQHIYFYICTFVFLKQQQQKCFMVKDLAFNINCQDYPQEFDGWSGYGDKQASPQMIQKYYPQNQVTLVTHVVRIDASRLD